MEKSSREAGALAIRNIRIIEQAFDLIDNEISDEIYHRVEKIISENAPEDWKTNLPCIEAQGWSGKESWFGLRDWEIEADELEARFWVWAESPDESDSWHVTQLCGQGAARTGFRWVCDYKLFMKKADWKKFAASRHSEFPRLSELGFQFEEKEGTWFLPLLVDPDKLAEKYAEEDTESVLTPAIKECLKNIHEAVPIFNTILIEAKQANKAGQ